MPFKLTEYDTAAARSATHAIRRLAFARSPLLAQIRTESGETAPTQRITERDGGQLELEPVPVSVEFSLDATVIAQGDIAAVLSALDGAGAMEEETLSGALIDSIVRVTELTGNRVDAGGQPLSWDHVIDAVETMDVSFDENGKTSLTLLMAPGLEGRLGAPSPDQQARHDQVLARKREEWRARRGERRLR